MKIKMKKRKGISLIVLIITIIVVIILTTAVILSISNNNPIENAKKARDAHNEAALKEAANLAYLDWYSENAMGEDVGDVEEYVQRVLGEQGFSETEIAKVKVTEDGVTIRSITFEKTGELVLGNEVTASNGEEFYIIGGDTVGTEISSSTKDIILLSKYNLKKENGEITLKQDTSGDSNPCAFSSTNYWSSIEGISYPADLNDDEKYPIGTATAVITTAKEYGKSLGVTGRLMNYEEAKSLETSYQNILFGKTTTNSNLLYWLSSAISYEMMWFVNGEGSEIFDNYFDAVYGVRPVIIVSKSLIK